VSGSDTIETDTHEGKITRHLLSTVKHFNAVFSSDSPNMYSIGPQIFLSVLVISDCYSTDYLKGNYKRD
jgi:hypothetical protein